LPAESLCQCDHQDGSAHGRLPLLQVFPHDQCQHLRLNLPPPPELPRPVRIPSLWVARHGDELAIPRSRQLPHNQRLQAPLLCRRARLLPRLALVRPRLVLRGERLALRQERAERVRVPLLRRVALFQVPPELDAELLPHPAAEGALEVVALAAGG